VIDPDIYGRADIAMLRGTALELIEVKEATWAKLDEAKRQLDNYVGKGRWVKEVERRWQEEGHPEQVGSVRSMPTSRYRTPNRPIDIEVADVGDYRVLLAWCGNGVILFKTVMEDSETIYCGISDHGHTARFVDELYDWGAARIEDAVRRVFGDAVTDMILAKLHDEFTGMVTTVLRRMIDEVCALAIEVTRSAVAAALGARLRNPRFGEDFVEEVLEEGRRTTGDGGLIAAAAVAIVAMIRALPVVVLAF
jgi:hypothetical protein